MLAESSSTVAACSELDSASAWDTAATWPAAQEMVPDEELI